MAERTDHIQANEALRRAFAQPSPTHQFLTGLAQALTEHAPQQPLTGNGWSAACARAALRTLAKYPEAIANAAIVRAFAAMPQMRPHDTQGEYALRLRDAARGL